MDRAIKAVGHARATDTRDVVRGLRELGVPCADRCKRVSRTKPVLPKRGFVHINRPPEEHRNGRFHWMLVWDGDVYDPSGAWPDGYANWKITSYLEIEA